MFSYKKLLKVRAVVVAKLVEHSLSTPEVRGSNPVIDKHLFVLLSIVLKDENKEKEAGNGPFFSKNGQDTNPDLPVRRSSS